MIMYIKRVVVRIIFCGELLLFAYVCMYGTHGLRRIACLEKEKQQLKTYIQVAQEEVSTIKQTIVAWQQDPFYKEKIARETLHMARAHEKVFYIK